MKSLHDIERALKTIWTNQEARVWLSQGDRSCPPPSLEGIDESVFRQIDQQGATLYANLMRAGHHDVMDSIYPYCRKLLGDKFDTVIDDYLSKYPPDHYNFNRLCCKLSQYFTTYGGTLVKQYPFLPDLSDYEWLELEKLEQDVRIAPQPAKPLADLSDIQTLRPILNPTITLRQYDYDVAAITERLDRSSKLSKPKPKQTLMVLLRNPNTQLCDFIELGQAAFDVVKAAPQASSYQQLIGIVLAINPTDPQQAVVDFLDLIEELKELQIIIGSQPALS